MSSSSRAADLLVTLALKPNRPGQNFITLGVFDTRRPAPAPIGQVRVQLQAQGSQTASPALVAAALGSGRYEISDGSIAHAGAWNVIVVVQRPGLPDATTTLPWTVLAPARPVLISDAPLAPWLVAAALIVALLCAALLGMWRLRRGMPAARLALAEGPHVPEHYVYILPEEKP
jgi:copper transport protein